MLSENRKHCSVRNREFPGSPVSLVLHELVQQPILMRANERLDIQVRCLPRNSNFDATLTDLQPERAAVGAAQHIWNQPSGKADFPPLLGRWAGSGTATPGQTLSCHS
jgi:hypothetical protein